MNAFWTYVLTAAPALFFLATLGVVYYLLKLVHRTQKDAEEGFILLITEQKARAKLQLEYEKLKANFAAISDGLADRDDDLQREKAARKAAEGHVRELLHEITTKGDPKAVASAIQKELDALHKLGSKQ